jgi:hypothetical protein
VKRGRLLELSGEWLFSYGQRRRGGAVRWSGFVRSAQTQSSQCSGATIRKVVGIEATQSGLVVVAPDGHRTRTRCR